MKQVPDLYVALAPSRLHVAVAVAGAVGTSALIVMLSLPWWCKAAVVAFCVAAMVVEIRSARAYARFRITLTAQRKVIVTDGSGRQRTGEVLDATYVSGAFTAIAWRPDGAHMPRVIPLAGDALCAEDARRTRTWLRYGRSGAEASDGPGASSAAWLEGDMAR